MVSYFSSRIATNSWPPFLKKVLKFPISKAGVKLLQLCGDELKLVYPQPEAEPEKYAHLDFQHFFLQPIDGTELESNTKLAVEYCLTHPQWRLSLQLHKILKVR